MIKTVSLFVCLALGLMPLIAPAADLSCERYFLPKNVQFGVTIVTESEMEEVLAGYIRRYRHLGGEIYWQDQKTRSRYSDYVDQQALLAKRILLANLGRTLRLTEKMNISYLTGAQIEAIETALEDYSRLEFNDPNVTPDTLRQKAQDFVDSP